MNRCVWIASVAVLLLLLLCACQPVMPEDGGAPVTAEESAPETASAEAEVAEEAPAPSEPLRVLFLGDSYRITTNWGEDLHFAGMAAAADPPYTVETENVAVAHATLQGMWETGDALRKLQEGNWDVVVLHQVLPYFAVDFATEDASPEAYAAMEEAFLEYAPKFAEAAAQVGAKTALVVPAELQPESYVGLEDFISLVEQAAAASGAEVIPMGQAWQHALETNPEAGIFDPGGMESTIRGTYLSAAVLVASLLGVNPAEIDYSPASILPEHRSLSFLRVQYEEIPPEDLAFLRQMAWEAVQEYQAGK